MISRGFVFLTLLSTLQAIQISSGSQLSNSATSLLSLRVEETIVEIPLIIDCGEWDCSVTTIDGYTAEIIEIVENTIYIAVTDDDGNDVNDNDEIVFTVIIACTDSENCPLESFDTANVVVTLSDGEVVELEDIDIESEDL